MRTHQFSLRLAGAACRRASSKATPSASSPRAHAQPFTLCEPPSEAALEAIAAAQTRVFGVVHGNGARSGRKRLRALLQGPRQKLWYGYTARDLLPEFLAPIKEEYFREEEALQRLGKSRISGKMKPSLLATAEQLRFEEALPEAGEGVETMPYEALLAAHEIEERDTRMRLAATEGEKAEVEAEFQRLALDREQRPHAWDEWLDSKDAAAAAASGVGADGVAGDDKGAKVGADGKPRRKSTFVFRSGLDDKRKWGEELRAPAAAAAAAAPEAEGAAAAPVAETAGAAAPSASDATPAAEGEGEKATATASTAAPTSTPSPAPAAPPSAPDPLTLLQDVDPQRSPPAEVDAAFGAYCAARAAASWAHFSGLAASFERGVLFRDLQRRLAAGGHAQSADGLAEMLRADPALKARAFARSALQQLLARQAPAVTAAAATAAASASAGQLRGRVGSFAPSSQGSSPPSSSFERGGGGPPQQRPPSSFNRDGRDGRDGRDSRGQGQGQGQRGGGSWGPRRDGGSGGGSRGGSSGSGGSGGSRS